MVKIPGPNPPHMARATQTPMETIARPPLNLASTARYLFKHRTVTGRLPYNYLMTTWPKIFSASMAVFLKLTIAMKERVSIIKTIKHAAATLPP